MAAYVVLGVIAHFIVDIVIYFFKDNIPLSFDIIYSCLMTASFLLELFIYYKFIKLAKNLKEKHDMFESEVGYRLVIFI